MKTRIENLIKVAEFLEDSGTKVLLERWLQTLESKEKPLPFIGRFSAGKSSLINALIDSPVLPTACIETTAAMTSISFSQRPCAEIVYTDNRRESLEISEISDLRHGKIEEPEEEISSIEIGLPCDILSSGLMIIDSPGMDTIVNNHVTLAQYIMSEAVIVVYVMAGAPSDFDMGILRQLQANGTGIIVVRTHMEEIGTREEESFISAVESDENILSGLTQQVAYFPLTTLPNATGAARTEFERFRKYLKEEIACKIEDVYKVRLSDRLDGIAERFRKELTRQKDLLVSSADKSVSDCEKDINIINDSIRKIEASIDAMQTKLSREKNTLKANILEDVTDECEMSVRKFKSGLSTVSASALTNGNHVDYMEGLFQKALAEASAEAGAKVTSSLSQWAAKSTSDIAMDFSEIAVGLKKINIVFDSDFNLDRVNDIAEQQEAVVDKLQMLTAQFQEYSTYTDSQLSAMGVKREEIQHTLETLNATHKEAVDAINYLDNNYEPHYITRPSKMGKIMRRIGSAGDIAMLAIPAIGWEKGATMLAGKAAALAGKTGKIAQAGQKVLTAGSNLAKIVASTDKTKDMVMLLDMATKNLSDQELDQTRNALVKVQQNMQNTTPEQVVPEKKKPSMFDYLSLSYWFGKFGEWIDPPRQEIDHEYERRYREARQACEQRAFQIARARIDEERELGRIKSNAEAIELEKRFRKELLTKEQAQCERQIEKLAKKKDESLRKAIIESAVLQFKDAVKKIERHIERNLDNIMDDIYLQILSAASQSAYSQLTQAKSQLKSMMDAKESANAMAPIESVNQIIELTRR